MKLLLKRGWNSPTLNTWASFASRSLGLVLILPIILRRFSPEELTVWYLFNTLIGFQLLAELGFGATFVRVIAYAMGGAQNLRDAVAGKGGGSGTPNFELLEKIVGTMRIIYTRLTVLLAVALGIFGTWFLWKPVGALHTPNLGWAAWAVVFAVTTLSFRANLYSTWLQGANQIALLRRWESITAMAGIISSFIVLKCGGGLLALVIANQAWAAMNAWRNAWLSGRIVNGWLTKVQTHIFCDDVFAVVWPSAWRSGIGVAMSQGVLRLSGLIFAQSSDKNAVASYLLALDLQQKITQVSNAPFYSKLPSFARWWAEGRRSEMIHAAKKGMTLTLLTFVLPVVGLAYFGPMLLHLLQSRTSFPALHLWWLLALAGFAERYGAMHLQLYSTTNHIVWHIANGIAGSIFIVVALSFFPVLGVIALPLGLLLGNALFYAPYCARLSHKTFGLTFKDFEMKTLALPLLAFFVFYLCDIVFHFQQTR